MNSSSGPELLARAEQEVNEEYKLNDLMMASRSTAIWTVLACAEDLSIRPFVQGKQLTAQQNHAHADNIINVVRYPLRWLSRNAETEKRRGFDARLYAKGHRMLDLAENYEYFACAFSYLHRGAIQIEVDGSLLKPVHGFLDRPEFEAYSLLSCNVDNEEEATSISAGALREFENRVKVTGGRFACQVNPPYIRSLMAELRPVLFGRFELPPNWSLSRYTLADFREAYLALFTICSINYSGRLAAIEKGCADFGIADSIIVHSPEQLASRIARYSGLSADTSKAILEDLTYGSGGISYPDPAIQPLVPIDGANLAIMPSIILSNSAERNFCVLLNRLSHEREFYKPLAKQKEALLRARILEMLRSPRLRTWSGKVPGRKDLPDIDLAIIDDESKSCLLCELKWFISPSDPREWIEKGEEIAKGVSQALALRGAFMEDCVSLMACLGISKDYDMAAAVGTPGWIGQSELHHDDVHVIGAMHLASKLASADLPTTIRWLQSKQYLPVAGSHFSPVTCKFKVGNWELLWYQIMPLTADLFRPV